MNTRRFILLSGAVAIVVVAGYLGALQWFRRDRVVDSSKLITAVREFARDRAGRREALPSTVTLRELLAGRYLRAADMRAFDGVDVTFSVTADTIRPEQVLIEAGLPDGTRIATTADGSVHALTRE